MAKVKKAQGGDALKPRQYKRLGRIAESNPNRADKVADRMKTRASREERGRDIAKPVAAKAKDWALDNYRKEILNSLNKEDREFSKKMSMKAGAVKKPAGLRPPAKFNIPKIKKSKNGSSFPDLNKDGKITQADILKGRGVIAKKGANIKKAQNGDTTQVQNPIVLKPKGRTDMAGTDLFNRYSRDRNRASSMLSKDKDARARREEMMMKRIEKPRISSANKPGGMKLGGGIKKAQAGLKASNKRVGPIDPKGAWTKVQEMTIAGKKTPVSLKKDKQLGATKMKSNGKVKKKK
jgi:hypothetical protein